MTTTTTARRDGKGPIAILALYDEARSLGYPDRSARTYAVRGLSGAGWQYVLDELLADRAAGRSGSTLVKTEVL